MFNSLFGLGQKFPVFGGGAEGGKGGGGSAPGADPGAAKGQKMTTARPAPTPGKKTPGPAPMPSRDVSGPYVAAGADGGKSIVAGRPGGGYGQDYNMDGRISFGETLRDMTDRGGPGRSGGVFQGGGILSTAANVVTGGFGRDYNNDGRVSLAERGRDMTDGGGAGQSGDRFVGGGMMGAVGNLLGGPSAIGFQGGPTKPLAGDTQPVPAAPATTGGGDNPITGVVNSIVAGDPRITMPYGSLSFANPLASSVGPVAPPVPNIPGPEAHNANLAYLMNAADFAFVDPIGPGDPRSQPGFVPPKAMASATNLPQPNQQFAQGIAQILAQKGLLG